MSSSPVILSNSEGSLNRRNLRKSSPPEADQNDNSQAIYRLPLRSVGVQGDERSYAHPALLVPEKINNKTWEYFHEISPQITNKNKEINRVMFLLSGDQDRLAKAKLNFAYLTKNRLDLLRKIDSIVNKYTLKDKKCGHIWQLPVVLVPFGYDKKESIVLRPVESEEAMTVSFARIPDNTLKKITKEISALKAVDFVFYDITNKPPGTIEWE